ncbi:hypothetical protein KEM56_001238 [Ascosphaera pollenicola]|nr:hypothetical protein KEM56_001238 [Ascosphaera pollenicola]
MGLDGSQPPFLQRVFDRGFEKNPKSSLENHELACRDDESHIQHGTLEYKVYKRRFIGFGALILLNIVASWNVSPRKSFEPRMLNMSTDIVPQSSVVVWCMTKCGPKRSIVVSAIILIVGNWVRYVGTQVNIFGVVMLGQIIIGFAQPFFLSIPTKYSDMWFSDKGRTSATAVVSLANPLGGALGELVDPSLASKAHQVPTMVLYVSIISTVLALPAFFIPARPPTPPSPVVAEEKTPLRQSLKTLSKSPEFWVIWAAFSVYVGLFNAFSSVINSVFEPHGFTEDESGIAGAILIFVGLAGAAIISPVTDYHKHYLITVKILVPIIAGSYIGMAWAPSAPNVAAPYAVCAIVGASSFATLPVILEYLVEITYPIPPEVSSTLCWMGGQIFGAIIIIVDDALRAPESADPPKNMSKSLIFQAGLAGAMVPFPLMLGLFGRAHTLQARRSEAETLIKAEQHNNIIGHHQGDDNQTSVESV